MKNSGIGAFDLLVSVRTRLTLLPGDTVATEGTSVIASLPFMSTVFSSGFGFGTSQAACMSTVPRSPSKTAHGSFFAPAVSGVVAAPASASLDVESVGVPSPSAVVVCFGG